LKAEHNSQSLFYRSPFGAQPCGTEVTLRIGICSEAWPESVCVRYRIGEADAVYVGMHFFAKMLDTNYYEAKLVLPASPSLVFYTFEIKLNGISYSYGNNTACYGGIGKLSMENALPYQITVYDGNYKTPDWFKGHVMYQIFCDRFNRGTDTDSLSMRTDILPRSWGDTPYYKPEQFGGEYLANDFFGGNLKGICEKLDYLADLGISVLYLNPIFEAYSNHKYDTGNYEAIDPMFGTEEDFIALCEKAAKKGIRIVLDGVFNHTGSDSKYFNKQGKYPTLGAYQSKESPYYDWYDFKSHPDKYTCWWGIKTLPHVNELSPSYVDYILTNKNAIIKKWLRLGASGWRLDVVDELPDAFVKTLRSAVKSEKQDAVVIGEVWEDASNKISYGEQREYLGGHELDSAMNYPLRDALIAFVIGKIGGEEFNARLNSLKENYPSEAFHAMMNFLSSHDTARILTVLSDGDKALTKDEQANSFLSGEALETAKRKLHLITAMQMTLPGTPSIYYGDEALMQGYGDPFCRRCFPWGNEDAETTAFFKSMIQLRTQNPALLYGDVITVYGEGPVSAYLRIHNGKQMLILCNATTEHDWYAALELGKYGISKLKNIYSDETHASDTGRFNIYLPPCDYKIMEVY